MLENYGLYGVLAATVGMGILGYLWQYTKKKVVLLEEQLEEKEEKINWLRQRAIVSEQKQVEKEHENEKEILRLQHTIDALEAKAKEGTKNQVVAKIESQQATRERLLERAGLRL